MSIIEEALKKVQKDRLPTETISSVAIKKSTQNRLLPILIVCCISLLAVVGLRLNLFKGFGPKTESDSTTNYISLTPDILSNQNSTSKTAGILPKFKLNGIFYDAEKPFAIINNKIIEEGQDIKGLKLIKVFKDRVLISWQDKEMELTLN